MEAKIPKIIHYCWFGGNPKPELIKKCIESWRKHCPNYAIIEWNEDNFDIHSSPFVEEAYQAKKWAFVSDFVRAKVLMQKGGIYLDTDMELLKPLDSLLENGFFAGFEAKDTVAAGVIGCSKGNKVISDFYDYYNKAHFAPNSDDGVITSPIVLTNILIEMGIKLNGKKQCIREITVFSKPTFYPTGVNWVIGKYGPKTVGVHHYMDSWGRNSGMKERTRLSKLKLCMLYQARNLLGTSSIYRIGQKLRKPQ